MKVDKTCRGMRGQQATRDPECGRWPEWASLLFLAPTSHTLPTLTAPAPSYYQGDYPNPFTSTCPEGGQHLSQPTPRGASTTMGHGDHVATHFLHTMLCFFGDSMGYTKLSEHYWALIINLKGDSNSMEDNEDHHCTSH